jgi:ribosome-associated heat shock protein Hsp15
MRIDKWLWAARIFKTRTLASAAVSGGKVHLHDQRVKPARLVRVGDRLHIQRGIYQYCIDILSLNDKRRPAVEASLMFRETEESQKLREQTASRVKTENLAHGGYSSGRPDKRQRRHIVQFRQERDHNTK